MPHARILSLLSLIPSLVACSHAPSTSSAPESETKPAVEGGSITMQFAFVAPCRFTMGSGESEAGRARDESPHRTVHLSRGFHIARTEVTQAQWFDVMETRPWSGQRAVREHPQHPAVFVSWDDAAAFCRKLSEREGKTYRLPTEAEWECACRAGTSTPYNFGDDVVLLDDFAWYGLAGRGRDGHAQAVAGKMPNLLGLYDTHGNVSEWCADWYGPYAADEADDPTGPAAGEHRVVRGGSWYFGPERCRSANRGAAPPDVRDSTIGFRVVLDVDEEPRAPR